MMFRRLPVRIVWKADSTFDASSADVSMKDRLFSARSNGYSSGREVEARYVLAKVFASSVGTARRCFKSLLLPTNMITMFESAWSRSSFSHLVTFS